MRYFKVLGKTVGWEWDVSSSFYWLPWFSSDVDYEPDTLEHERNYRETHFGFAFWQFRVLTP